MNLPNLITLLRIFLIPVFILVFLTPTGPRSLAAAIIFFVASLTDLMDGYLARRWEQITKLGKFLDPIADKFLVLTALIMLVDFHRVSSWIAIVIIGRELAVTGLRAIASSSGIVIAADEAGKYKMVIQTISIGLLILEFKFGHFDFHVWGTFLLWISMILAILSGVQYFVKFLTQIDPTEIQ
ncbi:MAG TPA: CDP-diacylglycerol--glycerol-3-phosphate 3-phosphatidyltransferase [Nitrospiria bacterium]|nr:CDP-diacylglycerol--glycerol-3-phosphate 3-phosphatidyltransferase [Nitrospiria bacterium]HUK56815.1 CDP-diacylglycerol--glycerol-3-phosphate 3-phosphatidyltransferase [Nitrospiria bacterium]